MAERATPTARRILAFVAIVAVLVAAALAAGYHFHGHKPTAQRPDVAAAERPSTAPTTVASSATKPHGPPRSYMDLVLAANPHFPTTQPLDYPLPLGDAAHLTFTDPVYLCPRLNLWFSRPDAPSLETLLHGPKVVREFVKDQTHLVSENVVYVHWHIPPEATDWDPAPVVRRTDGSFELLLPTDRELVHQKLPNRPYRWDRAFSWGDRIVAPTSTGVSILSFSPQFSDAYHELLAPEQPDADHAQPQMLFDNQGLLAWIPWENGHPGSRSAARFDPSVNQWADLAAAGWPEKILHLVPLIDGTVLQLTAADEPAGNAAKGKSGDRVELNMSVAARPDVNESRVEQLVSDLADPDQKKRNAAYEELARYGPGVWPLLEKLADQQLPETRIRIRQLLRDKVRPTLGGMTLVDGRLRVVSRMNDNGLPDSRVLFYAPAGVSIPTDSEKHPRLVTPAWIQIRPGHGFELLEDLFPEDVTPDQPNTSISASGPEWVLTQEVKGPQRFVGNHFVPLLHKAERGTFTHLVGIDARGRWLFRPTSTESSSTLILDPTLPDATPRLPVWTITAAGGDTGWDQNDWPARYYNRQPWSLEEAAWRLHNPAKGDRYFNERKDIPRRPVARHAAEPTTQSTQPAATQATTEPAEPPILVDDHGNRFFDGQTQLRVITPVGKDITWTLPSVAEGHGFADGSVDLLRPGDGPLFLFNTPGRVLRISFDPKRAEPFELEGTFTRGIPNTDNPMRIWVDPAKRICMVYDKDELAVLFPDGRVPHGIAQLMLREDSGDIEEDER